MFKIVLVHNEYGKLSGEEVVVNGLERLLLQHGHPVVRFCRSSTEIPRKRWGQLQAFAAGIYNPFSRRAFGQFLDEHQPDIVHLHNLFPFISASILSECRRRGVPAVMTLHNFRLICPNALLMREGQICHECLGGHEWRCVRHNCESSLARSLGYAARTAFVRRSGLVRRQVSRFICLTQFQRQFYVREGFPPERLAIVPNLAPSCAPPSASTSPAGYIGYVGRVSPEKDVPTLLAAARLLREIPFQIAGDYWRMPELLPIAPPNVRFLGHLQQPQLEEFFRGMRVLAFATRCYENFPLVILDAMARQIPVVCTRIGGLPEIVEENVNGLLYEPGDATDLARKIKSLWTAPAMGQRLAQQAQAKVRKEYAAETVYERTLAVYQRASDELREKKRFVSG